MVRWLNDRKERKVLQIGVTDLSAAAPPAVATGGVVVRPLGFEPRTNGLRVHCSAVELEALARAGSVRGRRAPHTTRPDGVSEGT